MKERLSISVEVAVSGGSLGVVRTGTGCRALPAQARPS